MDEPPHQLEGIELHALLVSNVTREDLLEYIGWLRAKLDKLRDSEAVRDEGSQEITSSDDLQRTPSITSPRFDFLLAAELAGFAFEVRVGLTMTGLELTFFIYT